jgi:hypothetical protein
MITFRAQADSWDKKTVLTVDQPIQVQDTYLDTGTYVLKLLNSSSNRNIVQIFNSDQSHLINTIMAIPDYRVEPAGSSRFTFYETPQGTARAMHEWFYPGDNYGQEFRYPKHLRQLEVAQVITPPALIRTPEPPPAPVETKAAEPEPQPEVVNAPPPQPEEPVVIAQNNPPPAPQVTPAPEPAPQPTEPPAQLPQTATPFPLIGLGGLISLAGYALLRMKTVA